MADLNGRGIYTNLSTYSGRHQQGRSRWLYDAGYRAVPDITVQYRPNFPMATVSTSTGTAGEAAATLVLHH